MDFFVRTRGQWYADYKCHEELRRLLTPNGKMYGRKRLNLTASEQRKVAQAIKRTPHGPLALHFRHALTELPETPLTQQNKTESRLWQLGVDPCPLINHRVDQVALNESLGPS